MYSQMLEQTAALVFKRKYTGTANEWADEDSVVFRILCIDKTAVILMPALQSSPYLAYTGYLYLKRHQKLRLRYLKVAHNGQGRDCDILKTLWLAFPI